MGDIIKLQSGGLPMDAYCAMPGGSGPHPAIVLMHHQDALDGFTRDFADRLAQQGYAVLAPDNYHHSAPDLPLDEKKKRLEDDAMAADIAACIAWLKADPRCDGERLAIAGHCMGGRTTLLGAGLFPMFRAAIVYYGGGSLETRGKPKDGKTPFERFDRIRCPVQGFFGKQDKNPSPADVAKFDAALTEFSVPHEFHSYDNAEHAFCNFLAPRFREH